MDIFCLKASPEIKRKYFNRLITVLGNTMMTRYIYDDYQIWKISEKLFEEVISTNLSFFNKEGNRFIKNINLQK